MCFNDVISCIVILSFLFFSNFFYISCLSSLSSPCSGSLVDSPTTVTSIPCRCILTKSLATVRSARSVSLPLCFFISLTLKKPGKEKQKHSRREKLWISIEGFTCSSRRVGLAGSNNSVNKRKVRLLLRTSERRIRTQYCYLEQEEKPEGRVCQYARAVPNSHLLSYSVKQTCIPKRSILLPSTFKYYSFFLPR